MYIGNHNKSSMQNDHNESFITNLKRIILNLSSKLGKTFKNCNGAINHHCLLRG